MMVWAWLLFHGFLVIMLALDLGVFHRKSHEVRLKEALTWSAVWVSLALIFNLGIYFWQGRDKALEFLTGYLIEQSLSVDNLFVFLLIFSYFKVPAQYQHKVLFWGIVGAIVMRIIFILAGVALIKQFHWLIYILGGFLILTGIKMAWDKDKEIHPERNPLIRVFKRLLRVTPTFEGNRFFVYKPRLASSEAVPAPVDAAPAHTGSPGGSVPLESGTGTPDQPVAMKGTSYGWYTTPLFMVLLVVEMTDVVFAMDSIPAIMGITLDPFIVYTSNIMAVLGLRSLYFALAGIMRLFRFLHYGLAAILVFVGAKMAFSDFLKVPIGISLAIVACILVTSVLASILIRAAEKEVTEAAESLELEKASG